MLIPTAGRCVFKIAVILKKITGLQMPEPLILGQNQSFQTLKHSLQKSGKSKCGWHIRSVYGAYSDNVHALKKYSLKYFLPHYPDNQLLALLDQKCLVTEKTPVVPTKIYSGPFGVSLQLKEKSFLKEFIALSSGTFSSPKHYFFQCRERDSTNRRHPHDADSCW